MSASAFEEFADAMAAPSGPGPKTELSFSRAAVLGGGADGRLIAALCLAEGVAATLFSAYGQELELLRSAGGVTIRGAGPVGTYQTDRENNPSITTTGELDRAIQGADVIFLTGPVHKQRTYAMVLAEHLVDGQVLVLAPGRTLGAAEVAWLLRIGGCTCDYTLIELQNLPYWISESGGVLQLSSASATVAATLPAGRRAAVAALSRLLGEPETLQSTVHTSFHDGSALVEIPALLIGGPAAEDAMPQVPDGAAAIAENRTFRALIGASHQGIIARLADERRRVASRFGVRELPDDDTWLDRHAGSLRGEGARAVPDARSAMVAIRCGTIGSLVPLQSAACVAGLDVPATNAMITLASTVLDADIQSAGRRLGSIGISHGQIDDARRVLDAIAGGAR